MDFPVTIRGLPWTVRTAADGFFRWPPLLAAATTYGVLTLIEGGLCPDASSLAHEFYHRLHTHWLAYAVSYTVGRLWGSTYWKDEERAANQYQVAHAQDPDFVALANQIHAVTPQYPFVTINHPVS